MTDRFEDAVRDAAKHLGAASSSAPTYHGAFQRGRRRRLLKRSALAGAGALVVIAALMVNLGRVPGPQSSDTEEIVAVAPATAPAVVPTTAAVQSPSPTPAANSVVIPTPPAGTTPAATAQPTEPPAAPTKVPAAVNPTAIPTATPPTAVPSAAPTAVPTAKPEPSPSPTATAVPFVASEPLPTTNPGAAGTQAIPPVDSGGPGPEAGTGEATEPRPSIAATGLRADAVVVNGNLASGDGLACDLDGDAVADATCDLLSDYPCTGDGDVRAGYASVDVDGDLVADTCRAVGLTSCDTTRDGLGDTPCIIELLPEPQPDPAEPAGQQGDTPVDPDGE